MVCARLGHGPRGALGHGGGDAPQAERSGLGAPQLAAPGAAPRQGLQTKAGWLWAAVSHAGGAALPLRVVPLGGRAEPPTLGRGHSPVSAEAAGSEAFTVGNQVVRRTVEVLKLLPQRGRKGLPPFDQASRSSIRSPSPGRSPIGSPIGSPISSPICSSICSPCQWAERARCLLSSPVHRPGDAGRRAAHGS